MNGKKAKRLRKMARKLASEVDPENTEVGYEQVDNCHNWVPSETYDPDGYRLLKHVRSPGTIFHKSIFEGSYRALKKLYGGNNVNEELDAEVK